MNKEIIEKYMRIAIEEARFEYLRKYTDSVAEFVTNPELEELPSSTPNKSIENQKKQNQKKDLIQMIV